MARLTTFVEIQRYIAEQCDMHTCDLLEEQAGWAKSVVYLDGVTDHEARRAADAFMIWRPGCNLGRHTRLKWLPNCYFFEHDSDAMMFLLSLGDTTHEAD